jgi:SCP-2 sterol transfer family
VLPFLSPVWLEAFDAVLQADSTLGARFAAAPIAIAQEVTMGDSDTVRYAVVLDGAGGRLVTGAAAVDATAAAVTIACDRPTAAALAQGTLNAQGALTSGRLKVRGAVDRLAGASAALAAVGDLLAALRANTAF